MIKIVCAALLSWLILSALSAWGLLAFALPGAMAPQAVYWFAPLAGAGFTLAWMLVVWMWVAGAPPPSD